MTSGACQSPGLLWCCDERMVLIGSPPRKGCVAHRKGSGDLDWGQATHRPVRTLSARAVTCADTGLVVSQWIAARMPRGPALMVWGGAHVVPRAHTLIPQLGHDNDDARNDPRPGC
jgi:hypothetical protein